MGLASAASSCCLQPAAVALGRARGEWTAASAMLPELLGLDVVGSWGAPRGCSLPKELRSRVDSGGGRPEEAAEWEMGGGGSLLLLVGLLLDGES